MKRDLATDAPLVCSDRQGAHLLGVSRARFAELRRSGALRSVRWFGGRRTPLEEIQRLAREGVDLGGRPSRRRAKAPAGVVDPAALRALDVEAL